MGIFGDKKSNKVEKKVEPKKKEIKEVAKKENIGAGVVTKILK